MKLADHCEDLLREIRHKQGQTTSASRLGNARFDETHERFERSSNQQTQILKWLVDFAKEHFQDQDLLRVLSVGCGSGILDSPLIQALSPSCGQVAYTGFDPNSLACERFRQKFQHLQLENVQLDVHDKSIEAVRANGGFGGRSYDLLHAVHCLYYFNDPARELKLMRDLLSRNGKLVVVQAPKAELNQLADCFWGEHYSRDIWFSDRLQNYLQENGFSFDVHRLEGAVNIRRCFEPENQPGEMMLDFILQTPSPELDPQVRELSLEFLRHISYEDAGGVFAPHPADIFVINAA